ncbi:hypothetical protein ERY13_24475 [Paenibacillus mucilaginosus]|nr:hypothetical protein ERY13_24475 [Paenibacillus mucilaginosus]
MAAVKQAERRGTRQMNGQHEEQRSEQQKENKEQVGGLPREIAVYCLSGILTYPNFMQELGESLAQRLRVPGMRAAAQQLYPYGDRSRGGLRQLHETRGDLLLPAGRPERSLGGSRAAEELLGAGDAPARCLLAGHSAGGIAAVQAASILMRRTGRPPASLRVVMIGSPKCPVPPELQDYTLYIRAVNQGGRAPDPVTRLGSWGGWSRGRGGLPYWQAEKYAPSVRMSLALAGGHPDYFRSSSAYRDEAGMSNLDKVLNAIVGWLDLPTWMEGQSEDDDANKGHRNLGSL